MAFKRAKARIGERSTTSGSGPWTLSGAFDSSYHAFSTFLSDGDTTEVSIVEPGVAAWTGIGTFASVANTISPTSVEETWGTFGSGTKEIFAGALASRHLLREDISGAIVTTGTATAYAVASFTKYASLAKLDGQMIAFVPHATNTNTVGADVTLALDGLTAKPIRMQPGVALPNGSLILGTPYVVTYNNTDGVFYLHGMTNPYAVPLGGLMDFIGTSVPNSCYLFPTGQAISRATYAALFGLINTTYGSGDGSTTFNVPDLTGRVTAMKEATATRITTAGSGVDGATLGSAGGAQTVSLAANQIPAGVPSSGSNSLPLPAGIPKAASNSIVNGFVTASGSAVVPVDNSGSPSWGVASNTSSGTISVTSTNASQAAVNKMPPIIILNRILRVI